MNVFEFTAWKRKGEILLKKMVLLLAAVIFWVFILPVSSSAEGISAECAVVIEQSTGIVLFEKNAGQMRPPASTTKILTALIAIEECDMEEEFTVSSSSAAVDGSQLGLLAGEKIKLRDLLYMLLLKSANDAAETIAENIAGSIEAFAGMMNRRAVEIGCENSCFVNPHGLPDDGHYTTASDLAKIAREAMLNPLFAEIVSTKTKTLEYKNLTLSNSNRLLSDGTGFDGVKTGFTKKAGRCLVSSCQREGVRLICVTLNAPSDWADHRILADLCFPRVSVKAVLESGAYSRGKSVLNGAEEAELLNLMPLYGVAVDGVLPEYQIRENLPPLLFAPLSRFQSCGELCLVYEGRTVAKSTLYARQNVTEREGEKKGFWQRICEWFEDLFD